MAGISEIFSQTSHEGQYNIALESGITLLSLYILIYPINYPQIGKTRDSKIPKSLILIFGLSRNASSGNGQNCMECRYHISG